MICSRFPGVKARMIQRLMRIAPKFVFNLFPAYRGTGARIESISEDWKRVEIRLPLTWRNRNYVGTIFGGSLYAAIDPVYMIMLIELLGRDYIVWDKAATIRFRRPGRTTLRATFELTDEDLEEIRERVSTEGKIDWTREVELVDEDGVVHVECEKVIHIRRKTVS